MRALDVRTRGRQAITVTNKPSGPPSYKPTALRGLHESPLLKRYVLKMYMSVLSICMAVHLLLNSFCSSLRWICLSPFYRLGNITQKNAMLCLKLQAGEQEVGTPARPLKSSYLKSSIQLRDWQFPCTENQEIACLEMCSPATQPEGQKCLPQGRTQPYQWYSFSESWSCQLEDCSLQGLQRSQSLAPNQMAPVSTEVPTRPQSFKVSLYSW